GALEFSEKMASAGIQPIIGCALAIDFADQESAARNGNGPRIERPRIVLLAARETGYRNLIRLNSRAFLETASNDAPHVKSAWLDGETDGLIALSGGLGGPVGADLLAGQGGIDKSRCGARAAACGGALY